MPQYVVHYEAGRHFYSPTVVSRILVYDAYNSRCGGGEGSGRGGIT